MLLLLLLLSLVGALTSAQTITFVDCTSQPMTDSCNALSTTNAISCPSDSDCVACLFQCAIVPTQPPSGTECADSDCIQGICGGYSVYLNSTYGSCNGIYSDEYCEYCGACLGQFDRGSGFGSGEELCNSSYASLLCRLLPYDFGLCVITYGYQTCLQCAGTKNEVSIQQVCPALSVNNITSEEMDLICAASSMCTSDCDSSEFDCVYCNYIQDNNLCSVTTMPSLNCDIQIALACRFLDSQMNPTCEYHESTCEECGDYSQCDALTLNEFSLELIGVLCNNEIAEGCNELVTDSDCYTTNLPRKCDYCSITNPICMYDNQVATCNATVSTLMECYTDVSFLPCRLLYDSEYCTVCESALESCGIDQIDTSFPTELCYDDEFVGTCNLISAISPSICNDTISPIGCQFCQAVSNLCSASTNNLESAADFICSVNVSNICSMIVSDNGTCYSTASENECNVCRANLYFCPRDDGISSSGEEDGCESINGVYCRLIAGNLTECIGKYNVVVCTQCRPAVQHCGSLLLSELSDNQTDILCQDKENCQPLAINSNLCDFDLYEASCEFCADILQSLCPLTNNTGALCTSNTAEQCLTSYSYHPCYATLPPASCLYCETVVEVCPQIGFNLSFVPDAVCDDSMHVAVCDGIAYDSLCSSIYGEDACEYCNNVIRKCGSLPQNESISEILEQACNDLAQCQEIIVNTNDTTCENTYTLLDCAYCKFLYYSDCNGGSGRASSGTSGDGGGSGSGASGSGEPSNCSLEFNFYCNIILEDPQCNETYGTDCETCQGYVIQCPDYDESGNFSFCSSIFNIIICSQIPAGPACDSIDQSSLCAYCNFYTGNCTAEICSNEEFVQSCREILTQGSTPNFNSGSPASQQCLPCSIVFQICPNVFEPVTVSPSFSSSLPSLFSSASAKSIDLSTALLTLSSSVSESTFMTVINTFPISSTYSSFPVSSTSSSFESSFTFTSTASLESSIVTSSLIETTFITSSIMESSLLTSIMESSFKFSSITSSLMKASSIVESSTTTNIQTTSRMSTTNSDTSTTRTTTTTIQPTETPTFPVSYNYIYCMKRLWCNLRIVYMIT